MLGALANLLEGYEFDLEYFYCCALERSSIQSVQFYVLSEKTSAICEHNVSTGMAGCMQGLTWATFKRNFVTGFSKHLSCDINTTASVSSPPEMLNGF